MKLAAAILSLLMTQMVFAAELRVESCKAAGVSFNDVIEMKTYSNGQIKVFSLDRIEPAAASFGLVVTLDRGQELAELESFCRYVSGLSFVDLSKVVSSYDRGTNSLKLEMPVRHTEDAIDFKDKTLEIVVTKGAKKQKDVVRATLK